jgi:Flp pilus assembly protein TadD
MVSHNNYKVKAQPRGIMKTILISILTVALAGCAGSQVKLRMQEGSGELAVTPEAGKPYDYTVKIVNRSDIGYDPDDPETRRTTALTLLKDQCPKAQVMGETVVNTGSYLTGRPAKAYFVQVKCNS